MDAPAVAVSADGKTIAVGWMDTRRGRQERDVFWRVIQNGKAGPETPLDADTGGTQGHVALSIDKDGVVHAIWESEGKIKYRNSKDGKADVISAGGENEATQCALATNGEAVYALYECRRGGTVSVVRKVR